MINVNLIQKLQTYTSKISGEIRPILHKYGLTVQQWSLLEALVIYGEMNCKEASKHTGVLGPSLSRIKDNLQHNRSFIKCTESPADRRSELITITQKGKRMYKKLSPLISSALSESTHSIPELIKTLKQHQKAA